MLRYLWPIVIVCLAGCVQKSAGKPKESAMAEETAAAGESLNPFVDLARAQRETEARIREALEKSITLELKSVPLDEAVERIQKAAGVSFLIDEQGLTEEGVAIDEPVSFQAKETPLKQALDQMLERLGLGYDVENEAIEITTLIALEERLHNRHYDIADLLKWEEAHRYEPRARAHTLIRTDRSRSWLEEMIEYDTSGPWVDVDGTGGQLEAYGGVLSVRQTERVHDEIPGVLELLRLFIHDKFGKDQSVFLDSLSPHSKTLEIRRAFAKRVSVDFQKTPLKEVAAHFAKELKIPIVLNEQALIEEGLTPDEPITIELKDMTFKSVLRWILEPLGLEAIVSDGALTITTIIAADEKLHTVGYDVRDLMRSGLIERGQLERALGNETSGPWEEIDGTGGRFSEPLPGLVLIWQTERVQAEVAAVLDRLRENIKERKAKGAPPLEGPAIPKPEDVVIEVYLLHGSAKPEEVRQLIYDLVEPKTWEPQGDGRIRIVDNLFIVKNRVSVHRQVQNLLVRMAKELNESWLQQGFRATPPPFTGP